MSRALHQWTAHCHRTFQDRLTYSLHAIGAYRTPARKELGTSNNEVPSSSQYT